MSNGDMTISIPVPAERAAAETPDASAGIEVEIEGESDKSGKDDTPVDDIAALKAEIAELRKATIDANERAARSAADHGRAQAEKVEVETQALDLRKTTISTSLLTAKEQATTAENEAARLLEAGDYQGAAKKNRELSRLEAKIVELERHDEQLKAAPAPKVKPAASSADPIDSFISNAGLLPKEADWVRRNKDVVTDPKKNRALSAAATLAEDRGLERASPEYFDFIERQLRIKEDKPEKASAASEERKVAPVAAPVAAPVSRGGSSTSRGKVKLTASQVSAAIDMGMTPERYADIVFQMSQPGYDGPKFVN